MANSKVSKDPNVISIRPQPKQELFLASDADIAIYGGSAGGGKTWSLLIEPLRHIANPEFGAVIFRRTIPEITKEGAMWDESMKIYPLLGSRPNANTFRHLFPSGAKISFSHLQFDKDIESLKGAQIPLILVDQLETFTRAQFFYMLSRNRSTCGIRPYVRATCNPEPGWLADFLSWWIDEDGYARLDRVGKIRWMVRIEEELYWADTREELLSSFPEIQPKSVTFILSTLYDNQILMQKDPGYLANLQALSLVDRERLLGDKHRGGNWKIKPEAGNLFNRSWFEIVDALPAGIGRFTRFYDLAATEKQVSSPDPDFTASAKGAMHGGVLYIVDYTSERIGPAETDRYMLSRASQDGKGCRIRWEQEPGSAGKRDSYRLVTMLQGYDAGGVSTLSRDKVFRAKPLAAQALAGNVKLLRGDWNEAWLQHMHSQPNPKLHDDGMDASSGLYNSLVSDKARVGGKAQISRMLEEKR